MNGITLLKCICEETRFNILELLQKNNEMSVNDLVMKLKKDQPLVSHHLRLLKECGIVTASERGKMTMYAIANKDISRMISDIVKTSEKMATVCCETPGCC
ncbi:MAG: metalloregulator ArsR/SmtB family transcription factor [Candidatus Nitrosotenuis sp.]|uniref:Transcriptional regulator, ArsR family n=1 Tax=Candidatus Nitrosotenuis uzonensis TaxID=1407055 RepID=A0A812F3Z3_9ARCH|nr:metalloregulator ArsR/SmtB family transcription factor [Candidatus Nitrosotenuis uzonensis]CAE6492893.1 Transcriptional regulator, ArsR family [Candidatus Nitrosotenuis uzonensis]